MRHAHILRRNERTTSPSMAVWLDVESVREPVSDTEERHVLDFGCAAYRRRTRGMEWSRPEWIDYTDPEAFWAWADRRTRSKARLYLYAHNAAYDLTVLKSWEILPRMGYTLTKAILDAPPFICHWRRGSHAITAVDTLNLWKVPLAELGKELGLPKLPMPDPGASRAEWQRYNRRDVEIIMRACLDWWGWLRKEDMGNAATTIAAQALNAYRHRYMHHEILIDSNEPALERSRAAYHGGRCECYRIGQVEGPLYLLDVRSEYPAVMRRERYPIRCMGRYRRVSPLELAGWLEKYSVIADVDLETDEPCYPYRERSPLLFPVGAFRTTLATPELIHALIRGRVKKIHETIVFKDAPIFRRYVDSLYQLRAAAQRRDDAIAAWTLKLLLNSLYGKFGQRGWKYRTVAQTPDMTPRVWSEYDHDSGRLYRMRQLAGMVQEHWQEGESRHSLPAIAAHVTAYGRMYLWDLMGHAGRENVIYVDTDSLLVTEAGLRRLGPELLDDGVGGLKLERTAQTAILYSPKDYQIGKERRTKGVRRNAEWLDARTLIQERWLGIRALTWRGDVSAPIVRRETKRLDQTYTKGVILPGGHVRPYRLPAEWGAWIRQRPHRKDG